MNVFIRVSHVLSFVVYGFIVFIIGQLVWFDGAGFYWFENRRLDLFAAFVAMMLGAIGFFSVLNYMIVGQFHPWAKQQKADAK